MRKGIQRRAGSSRPQCLQSVRTGLSVDEIHRAFHDNLLFMQGRFPAVATMNDYYLALAYTVRERLLQHWINTAETYRQKRSRTVCFISAEFLPGPHLGNTLINLGIYDRVAKAVGKDGLDLGKLLEQEEEPGLGNGGLGRLAACYMDSLATLEIPTIGYGIRYEFGIFDQQIRDGWQVEVTDKWLRLGNPWEMSRPEVSFEVKFGGHTESYLDARKRNRVRWVPDHVVKGVPCDTPLPGYRVNTAALLRLWRAEACESFDFRAFNVGDYYGAVMQKMVSENITKVLYPNDERVEGKILRLQQQYFFVSCSLQDMIRLHLQTAKDLSKFHEKFAVQLNDTHPAIAVPELMRLLIDEYGMEWEPAWDITRKTFAYTNHTLMPEALEKWAVPLFSRVLPRIMEIVYEINRRFLNEVRVRYPGDEDRARRMSLIAEQDEKYVRMANLACVGSYSVNGVSKLHSELLRTRVLRDFHEFWPGKFSNKTNGVTPRRFVALCNPRLTALICGAIGDKWISRLEELERLTPFADDPAFLKEWRKVKRANKQDLASVIQERIGIAVNPDSLFDVQAKRIHEYKRQHLNLLHVITLYNRLKRNPAMETPARTFIFSGKAAPGYYAAKLIIKLVCSVADAINNDASIRNRLKVVFFPDFNVKNAQRIYPAADLSEQISTAGLEASGTGNMKFALNGALTIGTLDGANIEIRDAVGPENFFLFGLTVEEVDRKKSAGYNPGECCRANPELKEAIGMISSGVFSPRERDLFKPLISTLFESDKYMLFADYPAYVKCQEAVGAAYTDAHRWAKMSVLNVARMGYFSSDRAIAEYCADIWKVKPVPIKLVD